mmetsp:Transcript_19660/g.40028  ORF Transcript_19660/g.40028 Transcript_19660/m.40028 type:complete len:458 (+) Transcript_19660:237-1610(+)|eukprot:CAMPEP_0181306318 /NCGR_PEP_ID=MMETSP1101-20121128/10231_1 /TAXON_ID=46948 /ORGANISM="Rhodomonas abbreviata, Strain Caron Lab Isolate" /LENGTH=457 /DNA_ID=CAMNT_0023412357 /DNA_START=289 /DNA_END=1662 /DNA_ORIENTATION=+
MRSYERAASSDEIRVDGVARSTSSQEEVEAALREMCINEEGKENEYEQDEGTNSGEGSPAGSDPKKSRGRMGLGMVAGGLKGIWNSAKNKLGKGGQPKEDYAKLIEKVAACRHPLAAPTGGLINEDHESIRVSRSVVAEVVKQIGKKLLGGQNLMSVTFPVRCCQPRTILECAAYQFCFAPYYLGRAAKATDPVERLKNVTACFVACIHTTSQFTKPFNPTLGETFQASFPDGTKLYLEQTSHHPPVTSWQLCGPNGSFHYYGWSTYTASFGYNRLYVKQSGARVCEFPDGTKITAGFSMDRYNNVYWGDVIQEVLGEYVFRDLKNDLACSLFLNTTKHLPSDVFIGSIDKVNKDGEPIEQVCDADGSFLGFLDFDNKRYWEYKHKDCRTEHVLDPLPLPSDSRFRKDRNALESGDVDAAQVHKVEIEERQRRERRLRVAAKKAKESGSEWSPADVK